MFGQRVRDYTPAMLDELLASGEVIWSGTGPIAGGSSGSSDGWVAFHPADTAPLTLTPPTELDLTDTHRAILDALDNGGAYFFRQLGIDNVSTETLKEALWQLIWSGRVTGDTFAPVRALLSGTRRSGTPAHRHRRAPRMSRYSVAHAQTRSTDPTVAGRWSALPTAEPDSTVRAHFQADLLLGRHGVLTRGAVAAENVPGGFATLYKVLTALEDAGRCQRGYFVESLGGAQFAVGVRPSTGCAPTPTASIVTTPGTGRDRRGGAGRSRSRQPVRRGAALADHAMPITRTGRAARPVHWWRSSTASWPGSSNAAADRC